MFLNLLCLIACLLCCLLMSYFWGAVLWLGICVEADCRQNYYLVIGPSTASSSTLTIASMQPTSPCMFLEAYHIPTCYILQHEKSLRFPEIPTHVKIKKQTNKQKTTTATSIIWSRSVIDYLGQLEKYRSVPKRINGRGI